MSDGEASFMLGLALGPLVGLLFWIVGTWIWEWYTGNASND